MDLNTLLILIAVIMAAILLLALPAAFFFLRKKIGLGMLTSRGDAQSDERQLLVQSCERLRDERNRLQEENRDLAVQLGALKTSMEAKDREIAVRNELLDTTRREMEQNFRLLAEKIFTEKGANITRTQQEELTRLLQPVREQLGEFRKKVEDVYDKETRDRVSLVKEIEHLKTLTQQVNKDAVNLTNALKGQTKTQGMWGEMILENLLENSGLKQGHEFETQTALKDKDGRTRMPDVLVRLPGEREIIIDAKVSLKAYEQLCRAESRDEENVYIGQHLESVKQHIKGLANKEYQSLEGVNTLDFIILFIPTEGAFQTAVSSEPDLLTEAMAKKIILASPSTLMAILRTVHHLWRQEEQARNSLIIAKQAGSLYDKFIGFLESFEEIGARLTQTQTAWDTAKSRLAGGRGNLVAKAEALKKLGVQSSKSLPPSMDIEYRGQADSNDEYRTP